MSEKEIIKGNRVIGIFDGWYQTKDNPKQPNWWLHPERSVWITDKIQFPISSPIFMKYHLSWSWLMDVLDKIEKLGYVSTIEKMSGEFDNHRVWFNKQETMEEVAHGARDESKFRAVYDAVVDFLEWYNKGLVAAISSTKA